MGSICIWVWEEKDEEHWCEGRTEEGRSRGCWTSSTSRWYPIITAPATGVLPYYHTTILPTLRTLLDVSTIDTTTPSSRILGPIFLPFDPRVCASNLIYSWSIYVFSTATTITTTTTSYLRYTPVYTKPWAFIMYLWFIDIYMIRVRLCVCTIQNHSHTF